MSPVTEFVKDFLIVGRTPRGSAEPRILHKIRIPLLFGRVLGTLPTPSPSLPVTEPHTPPQSHVTAPQQERSRRTLRRIAEAGFRILRDEGPDAVTVTGVAKRARTSVGSFYARFDSKEALIRYLGERALEDALEQWTDRPAPTSDALPLRDRLDAPLALLLDLHLTGPALALALLDGVEDPEPPRRRRLENQVVEELHRDLNPTEGEPSDPSPETLLPFRILFAFLREVALRAREEEASGFPAPDALRAELVEGLAAYLGEGRASANASVGALDLKEDVNPFDVWG